MPLGRPLSYRLTLKNYVATLKAKAQEGLGEDGDLTSAIEDLDTLLEKEPELEAAKVLREKLAGLADEADLD
jgi:hypothetical protein